jgi:hypothetical protein
MVIMEEIGHDGKRQAGLPAVKKRVIVVGRKREER